MYLMDACLMGVHLMGMHLMGVHLISWACISFTSLPSAQDTGGESPCIDTQDGLKASDCGRLGRQAAGHPWSALRVVKSCRKDCPPAHARPNVEEEICNQHGTRRYYLHYLVERRARRE